MDTKTALGAAGGVTLTVVGAVTALLLTIGTASPAAGDPPAEQQIQYVDTNGNIVDAPSVTGPALPEIVVTTEMPDTVIAATAPEDEAAAYDAEAYEEEAYEEDEDAYEEGEEEAYEEGEEEAYEEDEDDYEDEDDD